MSERVMLADHGTKLMELKPSMVVQAAEEDIRRHKRNKEAAQWTGEPYEHFAFHRKHVRKAVDALDLLVRAYVEPGVGQASAKYNTVLLYSDDQLLMAAIDLARRE
jgi:hypothetical protein